MLSCSVVSDSATLWTAAHQAWTAAHQASLCMEFSRQEYWSGLPFPPPVDLPPSRDWTRVSCVPCISRRLLYHWATWEAPTITKHKEKVNLTGWLLNTSSEWMEYSSLLLSRVTFRIMCSQYTKGRDCHFRKPHTIHLVKNSQTKSLRMAIWRVTGQQRNFV